MNFIYGIMCHQLTNPLVYLVNELIKSPNSKILIHVDKKSDLDHIKKIVTKQLTNRIFDRKSGCALGWLYSN